MINSVTNDRVDFVDYLLVGVQVEFVVVQGDDQLRVTAIHCFANGSVDLQVKRLHVFVEHLILFELGQKLSLAVATILWAPLVYFSQAHLID